MYIIYIILCTLWNIFKTLKTSGDGNFWSPYLEYKIVHGDSQFYTLSRWQ
jgi:hypothetical protein